MKRKLIKSTIAAFLLFTFIQCKNQENTIDKGTEISYYTFNEKGDLQRPLDYRTWIFAGTATTPISINPNQLFPDFQNVYIDPVSYEFWKNNGYFREGTIMIKELLHATDQTSLPIGTGFVQGNAYDIAVTIKDTVRFPNVPGGWEYFHFGEDENGDYDDFASNIGKKDGCIACHSQAKAGYGPFPELYAPLRDAKGIGKNNPENLKNRKTLPSNQLKLLKDKI